MDVKISLVFICLTLLLSAGSCYADEAQLDWSGQWHNPEYRGQGIDIATYSDGVLIAHYYGYQDDGSQMWLIAVGEREGDTAALKVWTTRDGFNAGMQAPHTEIEWGTLEIREENGTLYMQAYPNDQIGWEYPLYPIYMPVPPEQPDAEPAEQPDAEPAEEPADEPAEPPDDEPAEPPDDEPAEQPDDEPAEQPAALIRIETPIYTETGIRWIEQPGQKLVSVMKLPSRIRITVIEGTLSITGTYAEGPHHPTLTGVKRGQVVQAGETVEVRCDVDRDKRKQQSGVYSIVDFGVYTAELGQILQLSAQVAK